MLAKASGEAQKASMRRHTRHAQASSKMLIPQFGALHLTERDEKMPHLHERGRCEHTL